MALPANEPTIDTCTACGKLIPRATLRLCTSCGLVEDNRFQVVREYLLHHDGAAVGEIARATGVSGRDVRRFMDGGRLTQVTGGLAACTCGGVGTRCRYCRSQLTQAFRKMETEIQREQRDRPTGEDGRTSSVPRQRRSRRNGSGT